MSEIKNTLFVGKVLHHYKSLESTNDFAKDMLSKSKPLEGTAISTYNQTRGRGQIGSSWESAPDKNITCSIILYPKFIAPKHQFVLSQITALAVHQTVSQLIDKPVFIKWPNDILIENRKVAGILIQNVLTSNSISEAVIGIGLNVNQKSFSKFSTQPTSLLLESNESYTLGDVMNRLMSNLEKYYLDLRKGRMDLIQNDYLKNLFRFKEMSDFMDASGRVFSGEIAGVTSSGYLEVDENGINSHLKTD